MSDKLASQRGLDRALVSEVRRVKLRTRRRMSADLMGQYRSAFRGSGLVFTDIREYMPGDDTKHIHWKITARNANGGAYVKSYEEDRQLNILLVVDVTRSTDFGAGTTKHERALEFCALIALLAKQSQDAIGLCSFSDTVEEFFPPNRKSSQIEKILARLLAVRALKPSTDIRHTLQYLAEQRLRPSIIFVVSDFLSAPFEHELRQLSSRHDVICVDLEHPREADLPNCGIVEFIDAESGSRCLIDTSSKRSRDFVAEDLKTRRQALRETCRKAGADFMILRDNPIKPLSELMNRRKSRMR